MRFTKKDDCYLDTKTGLEWSLDNCGAMDWLEAMDFCSNLGSGWRMPVVEELLSIVDYTKFDSVTELPSTLSSYYWSSSTCTGNPDFAWVVDFADGGVSYDYKTSRSYVLCVRRR